MTRKLMTAKVYVLKVVMLVIMIQTLVMLVISYKVARRSILRANSGSEHPMMKELSLVRMFILMYICLIVYIVLVVCDQITYRFMFESNHIDRISDCMKTWISVTSLVNPLFTLWVRKDFRKILYCRIGSHDTNEDMDLWEQIKWIHQSLRLMPK